MTTLLITNADKVIGLYVISTLPRLRKYANDLGVDLLAMDLVPLEKVGCVPEDVGSQVGKRRQVMEAVQQPLPLLLTEL
jgi:hypothetical protein